MIEMKPIFIDVFLSMFESLLWLQATAFIISLIILLFIDKISEVFKLTKKKKRKLKGNVMFILFFLVTMEIIYIVVK